MRVIRVRPRHIGWTRHDFIESWNRFDCARRAGGAERKKGVTGSADVVVGNVIYVWVQRFRLRLFDIGIGTCVFGSRKSAKGFAESKKRAREAKMT